MHDHCDHHGPANYGRAFAIGITLNLAYLIGEIAYGMNAKSLALLADAGHNFGDVVGLLMGWAAAVISLRPPSKKRTYGYRRSTILAALANSTLLMVALAAVAWEAIQRLQKPVEVPGGIVMAVAGIGILVNGGTALLFMRGRKDDLNIAGAYMHMASDALVALGVVISGAVMLATHLPWIDSAVSLVLAIVVGISAWKMLARSLDLALDAVPEGTDLEAIKACLKRIPGVTEVTDLHVWPMSTTEVALTAHITAPNGLPKTALNDAQEKMRHDLGIEHCTIQVNFEPGRPCPLEV